MDFKELPNLKFIEDQVLGNEILLDKIVRSMTKEFLIDVLLYKKHIKHNAYKEAARCVHKLKHTIGLLNLKENWKIADAHEINLNQDKIDLQTSFDSIIEKIALFLKVEANIKAS